MLDAIDLGRRDPSRAEPGGQGTGHVGGAATQLEDTAAAHLDQVADEIDLHRRFSSWYGYEFFVLCRA